jgi:two-component system LytT family response regulator
MQAEGRTCIVNLSHVCALEIREDGEYEVVLRSAHRLRMSRRYRKAVFDSLALT